MRPADLCAHGAATRDGRSRRSGRRSISSIPTLVVDGLRTMDEQVTRSASDERALALPRHRLLRARHAAGRRRTLRRARLLHRAAHPRDRRAPGAGCAALAASMILIVREMALIAGVAIAVALPSVVGLAQLFRTQLYGVTAADPLALAGAVALTIVMIVLAAALPARRAASIEPMQALRME